MKNRCQWAMNDEKMERYHDEVWGVPEYDDQKLFGKLCLDLMQAGLSWRTILYKWEGFMEAFDDFHMETVAKYDEAKYEELLENPNIIRNKLKIRAIIHNAARVMEVQQEFGSFSAYLWGFTEGKTVKGYFKTWKDVPASSPLSDQISKDLKKRGFKFIGTTIVYAFLQAVGIIDDHVEGCWKRDGENDH